MTTLNLHPAMAAALASFAPPQSSVHRAAAASLNDDDLYVIDVRTHAIIQRHSCKSAMGENALVVGIAVKPGQALVRGMQLRGML